MGSHRKEKFREDERKRGLPHKCWGRAGKRGVWDYRDRGHSMGDFHRLLEVVDKSQPQTRFQHFGYGGGTGSGGTGG